MEQSYTMSFPASRSCLWDSSATGEQVDIHLTSSHWLVVYVKKTAISLAVKHHCNKVQTVPSQHSTTSLLLGQVYVNDTDDGLVLEVDRFDPGKVSPQENQMLAPTATLPGDYIIPLTVVSSSTPNVEGMMTHNMVDMGNSLKKLSDHCKSVTVLEPARMASIRMVCSCDPDGSSHVAIKCGCVLVDHLISTTPIPTLPIVPTALARNLMGPHPLSVVQSRIRNGFLTMEQTRKLVLLLPSDPKVSSLPLIGVWLSGVSTPHHPAVWTACVQYVSSLSPLRDRVFSEDGCFLVLLFPPSPTQPVCLQAKVGQDGCYDFHTCGCRVTSDELQTPNHIPLELIPAGSKSADHTLFMSALKSYTGDHVIPRTDHVIPAPAVHGLDENTSPDPLPMPTMAPRPPKRSDGSLCVSVLDDEGHGSLQQQASLGGVAALLADNTARLMNTTSDRSSCGDTSSCCSADALSQHQPVEEVDLITLQQKIKMLLQTHPLVKNDVISDGDHMSGSATPSSCSNDESFVSHLTPQPHPCLSGLVCGSDSSGCGCSTNTLDMQSYEESTILDGSMGLECAKKERLRTSARLPHLSQLSSPIVGESASIVATSGDHNPANQPKNLQLHTFKQHLNQVLAAQTDYSIGSCDPDITHISDQSMLTLPEHQEDGLSMHRHTIHDDNDVTILPIPRIQCSNSYYHGNTSTSSSNITTDQHSQMAELIALKYLKKHQLVTEGNTLPLATRYTEVSMATRQYLQRHGLDNDSILVMNRKPHKLSSDPSNHSDDSDVVDTRKLRWLPKLY